MIDVLVHGEGPLARALVRRLRAGGADARLRPAARVVDDPLGIALPWQAELPQRFVAALGDAARPLVDWARASWSHPPARVRWRCAPAEAEAAIAALAGLGLAGDRDPLGFVFEGGLADEGGAVPETGAEEAAEAEIHVLAPGPRRPGGWLEDKLMPVRWQGLQLRAPTPLPVEVSRHASVFVRGEQILGARWAEAHLGVGEVEPLPRAGVSETLARLAAQDHGVGPGTAFAHIVHESCDGLPIVGPRPGAPREVFLAGFGINGPTWGPAAVAAVAAGILAEPGSTLPAPLRASRLG